MTIRKPLVGAVSIAAAVAALNACTYTPTADRNYHGTVGGTEAPSSTVSTPAVPAYPVTISATGEGVETAELVAHGYTVHYQASSNYLIVKPVLADGSEGAAMINAGGGSSGGGVTGTTTYRATGRTTFHVYNTTGPWTLTFDPL
jgi:hypothetical protein